MLILYFVISFIIVYLIYILFVVVNPRGRKKLKTGIEARFLEKVYKVDISKIKDIRYANHIAFTNSLIISFSFTLINFLLKNMILQILIAFPLIVLLIIINYSILGRMYKKYVWFI